MEKVDTLTSFQKKVYLSLTQIPMGTVATYGGLSSYLNCNSAQAVGQALKKNPLAPTIPCHRVIKSTTFHIGGFMGKVEGDEIEKKKNLLKKEGVEFDSKGVLINHHLVFNFDSGTTMHNIEDLEEKEVTRLLKEFMRGLL